MLNQLCFWQDRVRMRFIRDCVIAILMTVVVSVPVYAQENLTGEARTMSRSVVLVLKLVSKTHVKPTTGIVISDDGLVLVPAPLVTEPGEIVVLDNGVDIAVNGRPAVIVDKPHSGGLALISVEGLKRPAITLSANALQANQSLHLETFPPAKFMAEGAQPLWVPVKMASKNSNMRVAVSAETPLPYVTGPIIDDCGYFAGLSLAIGPSSMELDKLPIVVFTDELQEIFDAMQVSLPSAQCQGVIPLQAELAANENLIEVNESSSAEEKESVVPEVVTEQAEATNEETESSGDIAQASPTTLTRPTASIWQSIPFWLILIAVFIIGSLVWKRVSQSRVSTGQQQSLFGFLRMLFPLLLLWSDD